MEELKELRFGETEVKLSGNLVPGAILPSKATELERNIVFKKDNRVDGAVFGNRIEVESGDLEIEGALFARHELYIRVEAQGTILFKKAVASGDSVVSRATGCELIFLSDINAKRVTLYNAYVAGSVYADEVVLENSVVIGGVFATHSLEINSSVVGTFHSPMVRASGTLYLLLPSAFAVEKMQTLPNTKLYNLALADLGALYAGRPETPVSGKICMEIGTDYVKSTLVADDMQRKLHSYTVIGKVVAADLLDTEKFNNHFLLSAAGLGAQLLTSYDLGLDATNAPIPITPQRLRTFFLDILACKIAIRELDSSFELSKLGDGV